jgi:hypothetical protein
VKIWDTRFNQELLTIGGHPGPVFAVAWSPDGMQLASAGASGNILIHDASFGYAAIHPAPPAIATRPATPASQNRGP